MNTIIFEEYQKISEVSLCVVDLNLCIMESLLHYVTSLTAKQTAVRSEPEHYQVHRSLQKHIPRLVAMQ